jgi:poly(3-hydroxybutyrate) depolymerase
MTMDRIRPHLGGHFVSRARAMTMMATMAASCACQGAAVLEPLPALGADAGNVTVSGLSSGGFMAVQFHVAYSASVRGAGVLAGGPYYCARDRGLLAVSACMSPTALFPTPPLERLLREVDAQAAAQHIDAPAHLAASRVWLFSGGKDETVKTRVVDLTHDFYRTWLPAPAVLYERVPAAGHALLNPDARAAGECSGSNSPYINQCGDFDAPGRLLTHLLGALAPKAASTGGERLIFDQGEFVAGGKTASMDEKAYVYIPRRCRAGGCGVHVVFHGCKQQAEVVGETFVRETGYDRWAESNRLIVLYPQTLSNTSNPGGCWDWWGHTGRGYHLRSAPQMRAVKAMIDRLTAAAAANIVPEAASGTPR